MEIDSFHLNGVIAEQTGFQKWFNFRISSFFYSSARLPKSNYAVINELIILDAVVHKYLIWQLCILTSSAVLSILREIRPTSLRMNSLDGAEDPLNRT